MGDAGPGRVMRVGGVCLLREAGGLEVTLVDFVSETVRMEHGR